MRIPLQQSASRTLASVILLGLLPLAGCSEPVSSSTAEITYGASNLITERIAHVCFASDAYGSFNYRKWTRDAVKREWETKTGMRFVGWEPCHPSTTGKKIVVRFENRVAPEHTGTVRTVRLVSNFVTGTYDPSSPEPTQAQFASCQSREQYCVEAFAVYAFGVALGFNRDYSVPPAFPTDANMPPPPSLMHMDNAFLPAIHNGGVLSAADTVGAQQAYGAPLPYRWIAVDSAEFPGAANAIGSNDGSDERVCRGAVDGYVLPGRWVNGTCHIGFFGTQRSGLEPELLFGTGVFWRPKENVGIDAGVSATSTNVRFTVCRALDGGKYIYGRRSLNTTTTRCYIARNGTEYSWSAGFEVLGH